MRIPRVSETIIPRLAKAKINKEKKIKPKII